MFENHFHQSPFSGLGLVLKSNTSPSLSADIGKLLMKTGLIAWCGMAGSVLMERMHKMKMGGEYPSAGCPASSKK
jgi:hypothetical protein